MTELSIRPDEIRDALAKYVADYQPDAASREEVGTVASAGDGIARVSGLPSAMANELLEFEDGTRGLALNLDTREIGVVILGDFDKIEEGQTVRRTGEILSVPVGDDFMGRVVDPLGTPIDGLGEISASGRRALELQAPSVMDRKSVHEPMDVCCSSLYCRHTAPPLGIPVYLYSLCSSSLYCRRTAPPRDPRLCLVRVLRSRVINKMKRELL